MSVGFKQEVIEEPVQVKTDIDMTPPLTELTKLFPDWDLATIFSYAKSGKSRGEFDKERLIKKKRKAERRRPTKKEEGVKDVKIENSESAK